MRNNTQFKLLPVAAAILLAYGSAYAEDTEIRDLITPDSTFSVGVGAINNATDAKRFSQYTGLNQNASVLLDFDYNRREDVTGLWTKFSSRNLGLDTREINLSQSKQGDWKYAFDYNEIVRRDPYTIHTGMTGIGSTTPTINLIALPAMPAAWATANGLAASNGIQGGDVSLRMKRTALGVSGEKWITPELQFELSFRNEDKQGARMFGRVGIGSSDMLRSPATTGLGSFAILLTPEAINSTTQLLEGRLNFNRDNLAVTAGYFGSFFVNHNGNMSPIVPGILNRGALGAATGAGATASLSVQQIASSAVALPPDNQAHQVYLSGNYAFSDTTRSNFKLSYTHATQNENFIAQGFTPAVGAPANLGGVVDTTLAQFGLTMRPLKDLSVNASLRYEDRADKTPIFVYNTNGIVGNALNGTTNWPSGSQTRTSAKLDGVYRLPSGYSVAMGGDWERKATPLPPANTALFAAQVLFRPVLNEYGIHGDVRKAMSETINGVLGFEYKQRRGNDNEWFTTSGVTNANPLTSNVLVPFNPGLLNTGNRVLPDMYMDRNRTKLRGNVDWEATDKLSLQAIVEHTKDDYLRAIPGVTATVGGVVLPQVITTVAGARTIISDSLSLDGTYSISENWRVNGFWTYSYNRWNVNKANLGDDTRNTDNTLGFGVSGKATSRLSVGMDVLVTQDKTTFNNIVAIPNATPANNPNALGNIPGWVGQTLPGNYLPNINYKTSKLNLKAKYEVDKMSSVQALFSYQQFRTDDWQWGYNGVPFLYSDNTTVSQPMIQNLKYMSVSYILKF